MRQIPRLSVITVSIALLMTLSLLSTFEPLTSVVLGTIVLHETITRQSGWGIVCILLAVCLVSTTTVGIPV